MPNGALKVNVIRLDSEASLRPKGEANTVGSELVRTHGRYGVVDDGTRTKGCASK